MVVDVNPSGDLSVSSNNVTNIIDYLDYQVVIVQNNGRWENEVQELSPLGGTRVLNRTMLNSTDVLDSEGKRHVKTSLDLSLINYPERYSLLFVTEYKLPSLDCTIADVTGPPLLFQSQGLLSRYDRLRLVLDKGRQSMLSS
jgi:hypothetical protein